MSDNIDPNHEYLPFGFCKESEQQFKIIITSIILAMQFNVINEYTLNILWIQFRCYS